MDLDLDLRLIWIWIWVDLDLDLDLTFDLTITEGQPMNRQELREALRSECIRDDAYDLNGGHLPEKYTLGEADGKWFVYYSERGLESGKQEFASETDACTYLLNKLKKDPTAYV